MIQIYYYKDKLLVTKNNKLVFASDESYEVDTKRYYPAKLIVEKCKDIQMCLVDGISTILVPKLLEEKESTKKIYLLGNIYSVDTKTITNPITEEIPPFQVEKSRLFYAVGENGLIVSAISPGFRRLWCYGEEVETPKEKWNKIFPPVARLFPIQFTVRTDVTRYRLEGWSHTESLIYLEVNLREKALTAKVYNII